MSLIVKSAVKESLKKHNVASDFVEALDKEVAALVSKAADRATANGRKTVQARDL